MAAVEAGGMEATLIGVSCGMGMTPNDSCHGEGRITGLLREGKLGEAMEQAAEVVVGAAGGESAELRAKAAQRVASGEALEIFEAGVTFLLAAVTENVAGPEVSLPASLEGAAWATWGTVRLCENGEEMMGCTKSPQLLALAVTLLNDVLMDAELADKVTGIRTAPWWAARALMLQQRMLAGRSAALYVGLRRLFARTLTNVSSIMDEAKATAEWRNREATFWRVALAVAQIEVAMFEDSYGHVERAEALLISAAENAGVEVNMTGAMGKRTIHQVDEKAQLVVRVERRGIGFESLSDDEDEDEDEEGGASTRSNEAKTTSLVPEFDDGGVMEVPKLSDPSDVIAERRLRGVDQILLLALSVHVRRRAPPDELQRWQMAPYVEAVMSQPRMPHMVWRLGKLLKARHEKMRTRTAERSIVHMQNVADAYCESSPSWRKRVTYSMTVWFPLRLQLQKELGECMIALGLVGEGMQLFERMELWDSLISCYILLGKRPAGEALVRKRLEVRPGDPRLLNALGDLTDDPEHYEKAWESSGLKNSRAMRSLARYSARKKDWETCSERWEIALKRNPLHPQGWFQLGYAYMQLEENGKALHSFTRCTQLEGSNAHAWNNIAVLSLRLQRMDLAYSALTQTVKNAYEDWHMWANYAYVSTKTRQFNSAIQALNRVIDVTKGNKVDVDVIKALVQDLDGLQQLKNAHCSDDSEADNNGQGTGNEDVERDEIDFDSVMECLEHMDDDDDTLDETEEGRKEVKSLEEYLKELGAHGLSGIQEGMRKILKRCADSPLANSPSAGKLWGASSLFYRTIGEEDTSRECLMKQLRSLSGAAWKDDALLYEEFAEASLQLALSAQSQNTRRAYASARMHIRGVLKQAAETYEDTESFRKLTETHATIAELEQKAS